jgi:DNA-directed RNA polymerase specialized sigma24 family protein
VGGVEELALAGQDPSPSSVVAGKELLEKVRQRLSEGDRQLVELRSRGLSWEEIALSLGGTAGALRNQLARALDQVAVELNLDQMTL